MAKGNNDMLLIGGAALLAALAFSSSAKGENAPPPLVPPSDADHGANNVITTASPSTTTVTYSGPSDFIKKNWDAALKLYKVDRVPALMALAHSGVESGWGKHAPGNNFFGIKASSSWSGDTQMLKTFECGKTGQWQKDLPTLNPANLISVHAPGSTGSHAACNKKNYYTYRIYAKFRKYPSVLASYQDYANFLKSNQRYAGAFKYSDPLNTMEFARAVIEAGYATAPGYVKTLQDTITMVFNTAKQLGLVK